MIDWRAAQRYARALFALAVEHQVLEKIDRDLDSLFALLARYPEVSRLMLNPTLSQDQKEEVLRKLTPTDFAELLITFVKVLVRKGRFKELAGIKKLYRHLLEEQQGIEEVEILTARPLSAALAEKFHAGMSKKLNSKIRLIQKEQPDLIGGFILRFGGKEINTSYRRRLSDLKQLLTCA